MQPAAPRRIHLADGGSTLAVRCYRVPPYPEIHLQALAGPLLMVGGPAGHPTSVALESNLNSNHSYMEWADQASEESTTLGPQTKETKEKEWLSSSTCT